MKFLKINGKEFKDNSVTYYNLDNIISITKYKTFYRRYEKAQEEDYKIEIKFTNGSTLEISKKDLIIEIVDNIEL